MSAFRRIHGRRSWRSRIAAPLLLAAGSAFSQTPTEIAPAPGIGAKAPICPALANRFIPVGETIEARVVGLLDSAHLKPGKEIWLNSVYGEVDPECPMDANAVIYGHVTAASSSRNPDASELSLQFDHADCRGHARKEMKFWLVAVVAPPEDTRSVHDALPTGAGYIDDGWGSDQKLNPGGAPKFVRPGVVVGMKKLTLDPQGGPSCSARLTSTNRSVELGAGAVLVLAVPDAAH